MKRQQNSTFKDLYQPDMPSDLEGMLSQLRDIALTTEKRTGLPAPKVDPTVIRDLHRKAYSQGGNIGMDYSKGLCHRQTYCAEMFSSKAPLLKLKKMMIRDMRMEIMHKGKFLLLRLIEPCFKMSGVMTVVEDQEGSVCIMSIYNFVTRDSDNLDEVLPVGTILAVKEPYYKFSNTNSCVIRCDSPSDIVILQRLGPNTGVDESSLLMAEHLNLKEITWKNTASIDESVLAVSVANSTLSPLEYYKQKKFWDAIEASSRSIIQNRKLKKESEIPQADLIVRANSYLQVGLYEKCLSDVFQIIGKRFNDYTALYIAGQALYALRRFEEAHLIFNGLMQLFPGDEGLELFQKEMWLRSSTKRLEELREGKFDLNAMMAETRMTKTPRLDCADYFGPVKLVRNPKNGDYRLVATQVVEPGTLLLASKAFEIVYSPELKDAGSAFNLINFKTNICSDPGRSQLALKCALKLMANPSLALNLYDLKTIERNHDVRLYADDVNQREPVADMSHIHRIVGANSFNPESLDDTNLGTRRSQPTQDCGIWIPVSHIKHACESTAFFTFIGDFMFIRSKYRLEIGEEISIPYVEAVASLEERTEELSSRGVYCKCPLCELERSESKGQANRRNQLISEFKKKFALGERGDFAMVNRLIDQIKETYIKNNRHGGIQQALYLPYTALGAVYLSMDDRLNAARSFEKALRSLGFTDAHEEYILKSGAAGTSFPRPFLLSLAPMTAIHIYHYYWNADEYDQAEKWFRIARGLDKILHGGDEAVFKRLYHSFIVV